MRLLNIAIIIALGIIPNDSYSQTQANDSLHLCKVPDITNAHIRYLGIRATDAVWGSIPPWLRRPSLKAPGDYFRSLSAAHDVDLSISEKAEIRGLLSDMIKNSYYSRDILDSIAGFQYYLSEDSLYLPRDVLFRREYYTSYCTGDTTFVISGWLGRFLSFYRMIPGHTKYTLSELQDEVNGLMIAPRDLSETDTRRREEKNNYFIEYTNRDQMLRVRNYLVSTLVVIDEQKQIVNRSYYNLIEITKFLDKEAIP